MSQQHIMTKEDAKDILKHHSVQHTEVNHPKSENGFLGMLRPFQGHLREENYHEVIEAVKIFAHDFQEHDHIDKEVISALWGICHLARAWAVHPDGMLRRNHVITPEQVNLIEGWIDDISYAAMMLLDGASEQEAFHPYHKRVTEQQSKEGCL